MRVLVIGIDGGTWRVLDPFIEEGVTPCLKQLRDAGLHGELTSTIPPLTAPAWSTFQTGVNPGKHGVYDFVELDFENRSTKIVNSRSLKLKTLWEIASEAGKSVVTINVPMTYPPRQLNGAVVGGMLSPSVTPDFVSPAEIFEKVIEKVEGYRILVPRWSVKSLELPAFIAEEIAVEEKRFDVADLLADIYRPDLMMVHVQSSDVIQHALWHYLDSSWLEYSEEAHRTVSEFYRAVDARIARFLDKVSPDYVFLVSDHGFRSAGRQVRLNLFLKKKGLLKLTKPVISDLAEEFLRMVDRKNWMKRVAARLSGHGATRTLKRRKSDIFSTVDWARTRCFVTASINYGTIFFNRMFEPSETEKMVREIPDELTDPRNGKRVYVRALGRDELYGPNPEGAPPDIVLEPSEGYTTAQDLSGIRMFSDFRPGTENTGVHAMDGILVAVGKRYVPGTRIKAHLMDMAPTILSLLDISPPAQMDGHPIGATLADSRVKPQAGESSCQPSPPVYSEEEQKEVERRLRDLGYL